MNDLEPGIVVRYRSSLVIAICMNLWTFFVTSVIDASAVVTIELMVVASLVALLISILLRRNPA